jgi:predicted PurR-regulated permease PerM
MDSVLSKKNGEGNFIIPMILGRQFTVSPVSSILSMMFWGWIWGIKGLSLAVPILMIVSVLCENISPLSSVGTCMEYKRQTLVLL